MKMRWSLDVLYPSFDSDAFKQDLTKCTEGIRQIKKWTKINLSNQEEPVKKLEKYITTQNDFLHLYSRLHSFAQLTLSVEAKNEKALKTLEKLETMSTELAEPTVQFQKWLGSLNNLDQLISSSEILKEHRFYLLEQANKNQYLLSEQEEVILAKMKNTGSKAWAKLQELLTSTLLVEITVNDEEKQLPLPVVRNMAYDSDPQVRKMAYEAELKSYKKIEESSAASLNGIKGEFITISEKRGYQSPLEKTLLDSRMDQEILDAMLTAMRESLPSFHKFFRKKAELLGYKNGLPFYELFAPMGEVDMKYTYDEAREFIVKNFRTFSDKLANFADRAFAEHWIDAEPREGKRGGAFCSK
ncbi:M3 family metallopeptidase, partial [Tepidibacillus decaturensis]|uniref:M3 family metallopeptidase n=1 Tax=Tepidibacillus decaturensis TaxID=1413211 RepID=UPI00137AB4B5